MVSKFSLGIALRTGVLFATSALLCWMFLDTRWYLAIVLTAGLVAIELWQLTRYASSTDRELVRFLNAVAFEDLTQSFTGRTTISEDLGMAMTRVLERLRLSQNEREQQAKYLQTLLTHIPVALITIDTQGMVDLLNPAAKRLFERPIKHISEFSRFGEAFTIGVSDLMPSGSVLVPLENGSGGLQLKAAATAFSVGGQRRRLISFQNIESELNAQELEAWQSVIRVMAHEVMNSLTPISSLSETALNLVRDAVAVLPLDNPIASKLADVDEALETVTRRSEGLLHFVQSQRRVTKRLLADPIRIPLPRLFARMQRLFSSDLADREISFITRANPEILEIFADTELIEQALINLMRNAIEALRDATSAQIALTATRNAQGRVQISVADNGPGVDPASRDRIFVPFFTTKRHGSGVGLTLVRQIAAAHNATVELSETPGGGATFTLTF